MNPLISVIIPVYKVEKYLDACMTSVVEQTYRNLEIILVDDGSPDSCPEKCDDWASRDPRIRVVHKTNGGLSTARNAGLDIATGDYIAFVDSDDWIDKNMISRLYQWMIEHDSADVTVCGVVKEYENGAMENIDASYPERMFTREEALNSFLYHRDRMTDSVWNKLFSARFFRGERPLRFPDGINSEDYYLLSHVYDMMTGLYYNPEAFYHYRIRGNSISTKSRIDEHTYDKVKIADLCTKYLAARGYSDRHALGFFRMQGWYDVLYDILGKQPSAKEVSSARRELAKSAWIVYSDGTLSLMHRAKVWTFSHIPRVYHALTSRNHKRQLEHMQETQQREN
ncbi:glycosyltransferase family 2 protein [Bifidobacterium callimiconis]|uniref:glycosyltransferase family 2 protein n=1 Tax=Bifidobacterium callimiconis TaxID=2306973 RepID=UPI001BDC6B72|nr:glycosyltransferase family 2 protein [Bifidobacterium callimiconis]MBT1177297.1 glycosyltransferase family 2 protein [Bifidobacterium callimiconis]